MNPDTVTRLVRTLPQERVRGRRAENLERQDFPHPFGRYELLGPLGEGGMARVFRARLRGPGQFEKPLAVKVIRSRPLSSTRQRDGLMREARLGALLSHPNVVHTLECGEVDGQLFVAMELVDGGTLESVIRAAGPPPPSVALELAVQICLGVHHAHELRAEDAPAGLVHRDLKPSNVLLSRTGAVKVADFGIAKAVGTTDGTTLGGHTKGTPSYMSPEQVLGQPLDRRSDVFALGALLHFLFRGKTLFRGGSVVACMRAVTSPGRVLGDSRFHGELDGVVPGLSGVLSVALARDPDDRYGSAREMALYLKELRWLVPGTMELDEWLARSLPSGEQVSLGSGEVELATWTGEEPTTPPPGAPPPLSTLGASVLVPPSAPALRPLRDRSAPRISIDPSDSGTVRTRRPPRPWFWPALGATLTWAAVAIAALQFSAPAEEPPPLEAPPTADVAPVGADEARVDAVESSETVDPRADGLEEELPPPPASRPPPAGARELAAPKGPPPSELVRSTAPAAILDLTAPRPVQAGARLDLRWPGVAGTSDAWVWVRRPGDGWQRRALSPAPTGATARIQLPPGVVGQLLLYASADDGSPKTRNLGSRRDPIAVKIQQEASN